MMLTPVAEHGKDRYASIDYGKGKVFSYVPNLNQALLGIGTESLRQCDQILVQARTHYCFEG